MWHKILQVPHIRGWMQGWGREMGGGLRIHNYVTSSVPEKPSHGLQTTLQDIASCLIAVVDN